MESVTVMFGIWVVLLDELAGLVTDKHMNEVVATVTLATSSNFFGCQNLLGESPTYKPVKTLKHQIITSFVKG